MPNQSPYALDNLANFDSAPIWKQFEGQKIFFDGVFKGDYSLAVVNRHLAQALITAGIELVVHTAEDDWRTDPMLNEMPEVLARCVFDYPEKGVYDVHLRNNWPPRCDDMVGQLNAYACFAWEESLAPKALIDDFNLHLDLMMVTANFVEESFRNSGLVIPMTVVGNGTEHLKETSPAKGVKKPSRKRILHVSSCFPRKGADILVQAFVDEFGPADNVELFIKTFDNQHNKIGEYVDSARASHPNAPPITVLYESMPKAKLVDLMRSASVFAAPSRGEGFALPLAESLLHDIPVVTTNYSGQTDFCTADTAWLVDYSLTRSQAHVAASEAQWAEPSPASLRRMLRRAIEDDATSRAKVEAGKSLLAAYFKWSDVARRVAQSIQSVQARMTGEALDASIKIDLISTWDQICGIATYSGHLMHTPIFTGKVSTVLARKLTNDALVEGSDAFPAVDEVKRPWGYDFAGIQLLIEQIVSASGNVLWFQHHPGFFSNVDMDVITARFQAGKHAVRAITMHNVRETLHSSANEWLHAFDVIFVHTEEDRKILADGEYGPVAVIPHGILRHKNHVSPDAEHFTIGSFGFLYPHKNIPLLLEGFALARKIVPNLRLKIPCCARPEDKSWRERAKVEMLVDLLDLGDSVELDFDFLPDAIILDKLSSCNLLCFPYGPSLESATGAARIALAAGRPLLCSQSTVLRDIQPYGFTLRDLEPATLAEAIIVLAASPELLALRDEAREQLVTRYSYEAVSQRYSDIFARMLKAKAHA